MNKTAILLFILFCSFVYQNLFAQFLSEDYRSNECIITQLNTENGLPSNAITGLAWEKNGQLIFTTEGGIVRFNGQQILIDSLSTPFFSLLRTADNKLIALSRSGLAYEIRNGEICQFYSPKDSRNNRFTLSNLGAIGLDSDLFYQSLQANHPPFYWFNRPEAYRIGNKIIYNELLNLHICSEDGKYNIATLPKDRFYSRFIAIANKPYLLNRNCQLRSINLQKGTTELVPILNNPFSEKDYPVQYYYEYGQQFPIVIHGNQAWIIFENKNRQIEMKLISACIPAGIFIKQAEYVTQHEMLILGTESHGLFIIKKDYFKQALPDKLLSELGTAFYLQVPINDQAIISNRGYWVGPEEKLTRPGMGLHEDLGNSWLKDSKGNYWYSQKDSIVKHE